MSDIERTQAFDDAMQMAEDGEDQISAALRKVALSAALIFAVEDRELRWVDVPEWGGGVYLKPMTGEQRDRFEQSIIGKSGKGMNLINARARLVARTAVTEDGTRIFTDGDVERLGAKSAAALNRLFDVASTMNGMKEQDFEDLLEDFGSDPS